jgi:nucleobase:cation symporter-1, NCS1 family
VGVVAVSSASTHPKPTLTIKHSVGGFWIAEGFNPAQMQVPSSAVALGLNPGLAMVACLIGNLLVTGPVCAVGWLGSKVGMAFLTRA